MVAFSEMGRRMSQVRMKLLQRILLLFNKNLKQKKNEFGVVAKKYILRHIHKKRKAIFQPKCVGQDQVLRTISLLSVQVHSWYLYQFLIYFFQSSCFYSDFFPLKFISQEFLKSSFCCLALRQRSFLL